MRDNVALPSKFVRRTHLTPDEKRINFHQIDADALEVLCSEEADGITPKMAKIYLQLVRAQGDVHNGVVWERDGILRFSAAFREGKWITASRVLALQVGVSPTVAVKALRWMHQQGLIGYYSGRNGVPSRIFLNRAVSSIGLRKEKILNFPHSPTVATASPDSEPRFKDQRLLETTTDQITDPPSLALRRADPSVPFSDEQTERQSVDEIVRFKRFAADLEQRLTQSLNSALLKERSRVEQWIDTKLLPKAARVATAETLRVMDRAGKRQVSSAAVGLNIATQAPEEQSVPSLQTLAQMAESIAFLHRTSIREVLLEHVATGNLSIDQLPEVEALAESLTVRKETAA